MLCVGSNVGEGLRIRLGVADLGCCKMEVRKFAVRVSRWKCSGGMSVSAQRELAGLVRNAPVTIRRAEFWTGSRSFNCDCGAKPYIGVP